MPHTPPPFTALLERVQQGEEAALLELIQRYENIIRRAARGMIGPALRAHVDSLDLVQSVHRTMLRALRRQNLDLTSPDQLVALALTLVRRKVSRLWRKLKQQQGQPLTDGDLPRGSLPAGAAAANDAIAHLLDHLPDPLDRRLVTLRLEGHSTADIAAQLHLNAAALRVRHSRLRHRLRDQGLLTEWL